MRACVCVCDEDRLRYAVLCCTVLCCAEIGLWREKEKKRDMLLLC